MKKITAALLTAILLIAMAFTLTACDTEWDQAMKNAIKDFSSGNNSANYTLDVTCTYGYGTQYESGYKEKVLVGGGKYKQGDEDVRSGSYQFVREDCGNDAPIQAMLVGSLIGKEDYFTVESGKYTLLNDKKSEIGARIDELGSLDVITEMYYVINGGRITEYYTILDRSSGETSHPMPPMLIHIIFEYGNVSL